MIRFGAHAFVWVGDWTTETGNDAIRRAAETGFDFIEIPLLRPDRFDAAAHRAVLDETGLDATCSLTLPVDAHMPAHPEAAKRFLRSALDQVEAVGARYLGGCLAYHLGTLTGAPPREDELQVVAATLAEVAQEARAREITLALEACNRYETYLVNTLEDARNLIRRTRAPNLLLHADTYHMNIEEDGFRNALARTADVLDYVHMSESHRGLVGTGTVLWEDVWRGLSDAGFDGGLVLESFAAINPDLAAATCLWRPPSQSPERIATEGLAFLRDGARRHGLAG